MTITRDPNGEAFHHGMQCCVRSVSYNFRDLTGRLDMEDGDCCDMSGCIEFFQALDPGVRLIETFSGSERDTAYIRSPRGVWRPMDIHGVNDVQIEDVALKSD
jgi:hypothetical protein